MTTKLVNGKRVEMTQAEIDAQVQEDVSRAAGISVAEKALARTLSEVIWILNTGVIPGGAAPNMTREQAWQFTKDRLEFHVRDIKGLPT